MAIPPRQNGDLLEIRYVGRLADGTIFDGFELGSRLGDDSIQFVLGRQPAGQFPPSWDVGLVGMCVGEARELDVPPLLGFGAKGLPKRGVPPNARLICDRRGARTSAGWALGGALVAPNKASGISGTRRLHMAVWAERFCLLARRPTDASSRAQTKSS